jgi:hypothetical protein
MELTGRLAGTGLRVFPTTRPRGRVVLCLLPHSLEALRARFPSPYPRCIDKSKTRTRGPILVHARAKPPGAAR